MRLRSAALAAALTVPLACSRAPEGETAAARPSPAPAPQAAFDWERPIAALDLVPEAIAARLGSFEWAAAVEWTISREGEDARRVRVVERHRVRQSASGEFEAGADIDPGLGTGSDTAKDVVHAGGMTYARARYAPYRERPTDHGRDARRFRDESFHVARSVARLLGPSLELRPAGEVQALRRAARKLTVSLADGPAPAVPKVDPAGLDEDTRRRRAFLQGLRAQSAAGELVLDAASGAPLRVRLAAAFRVEGDPTARVVVELLAQVKAIGGDVAPIVPPKGALPDERKAAGVAGALEAAGLKKPAEKGEGGKQRGEPAEDAGEE